MELARIQQMFSQLSTEINDLRRIARRENVNMDYLKNVVVQVRVLTYLTAMAFVLIRPCY